MLIFSAALLCLTGAGLALVFFGNRLPSRGLWLGPVCSSLALLGVFSYLLPAARGEVTVETFKWAWLQTNDWNLALGLTINSDAVFLVAMVLIVSLCVQLYCVGYAASEERYGFLSGLLCTFTAAMMGAVLSSSLFGFFLCWEWMGFCSYLLIGFFRQKPAANRASLKAFLTTRVGDAAFFVGLAACLWLLRSLDFDALTAAIPTLSWQREAILGIPAAEFLAACFLVATIGKSAQFPLHFWLPDAMEGPTPVSALIHAATMVAAGVLLLVKLSPLYALAPITANCMTWIGLGTALLGATLAIFEDQFKRVLAYSTMSQLGLMVAAVGWNSPNAATFHLITHAFFKASLFLCAGWVTHLIHQHKLSAIAVTPVPNTFSYKILYGAFAVAGFSLAGAPFFSGALSKETILAAGAANGNSAQLYAMLATMTLTPVYVARLLLALRGGTDPAQSFGSTRWVILLPIVVLSLLSLGGWQHNLLVFAQMLPQAPSSLHNLSLTLMAAGTTLGILLFRHRPTFVELSFNNVTSFLALGWKRVLRGVSAFEDQFFDRHCVDGVAWLALRGRKIIQAVDDRVLDNLLVDGPAAFAGFSGMLLRRLQVGTVQQFSLLAIGMLILIAWLTR